MLAGAHRVLRVLTHRHGVVKPPGTIGKLPSMRRRRAWARSVHRMLQAVSRSSPSGWQVPHPYWDFPPLIRRKLDDASVPQLLVTEPGTGYRFVVPDYGGPQPARPGGTSLG